MKLYRINKTALTALLLIIIASSSAYAWGTGGSPCDGCPCPQAFVRGGGGGCPWDEFNDRWDEQDGLTSEQKEQLIALRRKFVDDTAPPRIALNTAYKNLAVLMGTSDPDRKAIQSLLKEISELNSTLMEKQVNHQLEVRKIAPDLEPGNMSRRCPKKDKPACMRDGRKNASDPGCCKQ